jgi:Transglutaminase-like superfamily
MKRLLKFWSLPGREKYCFCEAGILLLLSNLSINTIPFRQIYRFLLANSNNCTRVVLDSAENVELVMLSLSRAANVLPWKSQCLSQSIAAFVMLRRRGIRAVMFVGVKSLEDSSLLAHAWVHTGREVTDENSENSTYTALVSVGESIAGR